MQPAKRKTLQFLQRNGCEPACGHRGHYDFAMWFCAAKVGNRACENRTCQNWPLDWTLSWALLRDISWHLSWEFSWGVVAGLKHGKWALSWAHLWTHSWGPTCGIKFRGSHALRVARHAWFTNEFLKVFCSAKTLLSSSAWRQEIQRYALCSLAGPWGLLCFKLWARRLKMIGEVYPEEFKGSKRDLDTLSGNIPSRRIMHQEKICGMFPGLWQSFPDLWYPRIPLKQGKSDLLQNSLLSGPFNVQRNSSPEQVGVCFSSSRNPILFKEPSLEKTKPHSLKAIAALISLLGWSIASQRVTIARLPRECFRDVARFHGPDNPGKKPLSQDVGGSTRETM